MGRPYRRHDVGMVLRDAWLFGGTIRENITYGRENATWEEILAAAEAEHVEQGTHEGLLARAGPADT